MILGYTIYRKLFWLIIVFNLTLLLFPTAGFTQQMIMSPQPPPAGLSTSLAPQQALLPSPPAGEPVRQGYFKGKDGVQLFYRIVGKGKDTVVFVHGGPGGGMDDGGLDLEFLSQKGYTFIEYDQRGGARSELVRDTAKLTVADHVMDVEALRRQFNLQKLSLIGVSWGCRILAEYYNQFPDHVNRLVFLSPGPIVSGGQRRAATDSALGEYRRKRIAELTRLIDSASDRDLPSLWEQRMSIFGVVYVTDSSHLSRERGSMANFSPLALRNIRLQSFNRYYGNPPWDLRHLLRNIQVATIVIEGAQSVVPLNDIRQWSDNIKGAKLILIPNAGHQNWLDEPDVVLNQLDIFFKLTGRSKN